MSTPNEFSFNQAWIDSDRKLRQHINTALVVPHFSELSFPEIEPRNIGISDLYKNLAAIDFFCQGCLNYCGETHDGNKLVCAIHPNGMGMKTECPDFEIEEFERSPIDRKP